MIIMLGMVARGRSMSFWPNARSLFDSGRFRIGSAFWFGGGRKSVEIVNGRRRKLMASMKLLAHKALQRVGYDLVNTKSQRPIHVGSDRILGSFAPFRTWWYVGPPSNYFIHDGYRHRLRAPNYDATGKDHLWQCEVYQFAREIFDREGLESVCDIGCGSGFKLIKHFREFRTVGIEVAETCCYLRRQWPDRQWMVMDSESRVPFSVDMVIAADVI